MTRKLLAAFIAILLSALPSVARDSSGKTDYLRHSVYAGYSLKASSNVFSRALYDISDYSGVLGFGYEYRPVRMLGIGADFGWLNNVGEHRDQIDSPGGVSLPVSTPYINDIFMISANLRGIWVSLNHFSLYSSLRAGIALKTEGKTCTNVTNLLIVPIGVELGIKRIGAYAELTLGTYSTVSFGARFHF